VTRAARRHQRDIIAGMQRQLVGEPPPDGDTLPRVEPSSVPCLIFLAIEVRLLRSSARMPRTNTPAAPNADDPSRLAVHHRRRSLMPAT